MYSRKMYSKKMYDIKSSIKNNDPIDSVLHVIAVISNPCSFARRYILANEFIERMEQEENIILYIVEMVYPGQKFIITNKNNKRHLQLSSDVPMWHKENMINLGTKLFPPNWKAFAWIDADIEFENPYFALDTLKILNGCSDIVQLFSHCIDMNSSENTMHISTSAGYNYSKKKEFCSKGIDYWHPGYAWAMTRKAYEKIGGLYDLAILGSGDNIMLYSLLNNGLKSINEDSTEDYKLSILEYEKKISTLQFGYIPGVIRHYFHGSKKNRKYNDRWRILIKYNYSPVEHILKNKEGILIPSKYFCEEFKKEILNYFFERNEDQN